MRIVSAVSGVIISALASTTLAADPASPASQPFSASNAPLRIEVFELADQTEVLKNLKPERFVELADLAQPGSVRGRRKGGPQSIAVIQTHADLRKTATFMFGESVPVPEAAASQPGRLKREVSLTYKDVGVRCEVSCEDPSKVQLTNLPLKIKLEILTLQLMALEKVDKIKYEGTLNVTPAAPAVAMLDTAPIAVDDKGRGRIRFLCVRVDEKSASRLGSLPNQVGHDKFEETQDAHLEADAFSLIASPDVISDIDLKAVIDQAPSSAELRKRLAAGGTVSNVFTGQFNLLASFGTRFVIGESLPTVTDVNISPRGVVTPSITYKSIGSHCEMGPFKWEAGGWATASLRLESSSVLASGTQVQKGIRLPLYLQWRFDQPLRFQSGVPEYLILRGPPSAVPPDGDSTLYVVRLLLTQGSAR